MIEITDEAHEALMKAHGNSSKLISKGKSSTNDLLGDALKLADKREAAMKYVKPCPKCGTEQVQLVAWIYDVEWKCRHCKHEWEGT